MWREGSVRYTQDEGLRGFHAIMAAIVGPLWFADLLLVRVVHLYGFGQLCAPLATVLPATALYFYCRWRRFKKLEHIAGLSMWASVAANAISALIQICARTSSPLIDRSLAAADHELGLSTGAVVLWVTHFPYIRIPLAAAYMLLPILVAAALLLPVLSGRAQDAQRCVLRIVVAAIITAALFAKWPALGPWTMYGFPPTNAQAAQISYLHVLKSTQPVKIDLASSGIVTFPSFHVVLAMLSALALWRIRQVHWFAVLLGAAICVSTITTGWHYFSDVFGGVAVTVLASVIVSWSTKRAASNKSIIACQNAVVEEEAA